MRIRPLQLWNTQMLTDLQENCDDVLKWFISSLSFAFIFSSPSVTPRSRAESITHSLMAAGPREWTNKTSLKFRWSLLLDWVYVLINRILLCEDLFRLSLLYCFFHFPLLYVHFMRLIIEQHWKQNVWQNQKVTFVSPRNNSPQHILCEISKHTIPKSLS